MQKVRFCLAFALCCGACAATGTIEGAPGEPESPEPVQRRPGTDAASGSRAVEEWDESETPEIAADAGTRDAGRPPTVPPPLPAHEIRPLLTLATSGIADESFETDAWTRTFRFYKADATVVGGELRFGAVPGAGHPPQAILRLRGRNFAMQFRFRLEGSASLVIQTSDDKIRTHVGSMSIGTRGINLNRMTGWGGTTKYIRLVRQDLTIEKGRTYTALFEMQGDEMAVQIDGRCFAYAQAPELAASKSIVYLTGGGTYTFYDDVRLWQVSPNPEWPALRQQTLAEKRGCR